MRTNLVKNITIRPVGQGLACIAICTQDEALGFLSHRSSC